MMRAILLPVGADWFALPIESLRRVIAEPDVAPLPTAPATVVGVFNVRGEIVPLLDTAALLGLGRMTSTPFAAVVDSPWGLVALALGGVPEPVELERRVDAAQVPPVPGAVAVHDAGERVAVLLEPQGLLEPVRAAAMGGTLP
jgi:purine-binding chemotaxis protein CheW